MENKKENLQIDRIVLSLTNLWCSWKLVGRKECKERKVLISNGISPRRNRNWVHQRPERVVYRDFSHYEHVPVFLASGWRNNDTANIMYCLALLEHFEMRPSANAG